VREQESIAQVKQLNCIGYLPVTEVATPTSTPFSPLEPRFCESKSLPRITGWRKSLSVCANFARSTELNLSLGEANRTRSSAS
jgi:hypothetical protein